MVTENFETRFAENLGDSPIRSRGAVLQSSPDEIVDVVVAPVYSPAGTNGDQVDKLQETVLGELEAMYPAYRIRTSNLLLRGEEFFLFRLEHRS